MKNRVRQRTFNAKTLRSTARGPIGMAVFLALHGIPDPANAQQPPQQTESTSPVLQEVVVTANRRQENLEAVPSSIAVLSAAQLSATGVTDIASLIGQVPGLSMFDFGARDTGSVFPIIRGLNASDSAIANRDFRSFEQAPVGTYIGNSPINGYFQLDDVQRVEVLRGPQGTLYGAGALGGALRIIPNSPELGNFAGNVEASVGRLAHSRRHELLRKCNAQYSHRRHSGIPRFGQICIRTGLHQRVWKPSDQRVADQHSCARQSGGSGQQPRGIHRHEGLE